MKKLSLVFTIFACFFIFYLQPKAFDADYATITYNYNDPFVVDNHNSEFFGEDGYLENLRTGILNTFDHTTGQSNGYEIFFSKDDIMVHFTNDSSKLYFGAFGSSSEFYFAGRGNGRYYRFYNLSRYNSFSSFYNAVLSRSTSNSNNFPSFYLDNEITSDINYFDLGFDDYFIPYSVFHSHGDSLYVGSESSYSSHAEFPLSINGSVYHKGDVMPTYHDLFGYEEPSPGLSVDTSLVYNNAFIIDSNYLNDVSGSYEFIFKSSVPPRVSDLQFYGLVNDNGLYHYELLSSNVLCLANGSNVNFGDDDFDSSNVIFSYNGSKAVFSIASNSFVYTDLSRYESIYIKVNYDYPVLILNSSFNYHNDSPYIYSTIVNDVCAECLYTQMTSTFSNTVMFSADVEDSSTKLYFRDVSYLSSTIGQTLTLEYKPEYHSTVTNSFLSNDVHYYSRDYFYDTFNRVIFDNYNISPEVSLLMSLYQDLPDLSNNCSNWFCKFLRHIPLIGSLFTGTDNYSSSSGISGDVMLMFYISDNVYFGNTVYSSDKSHVEGVSTNGNGGVTHFSEEGDWSKVSTDYSFSNMFNNAVNESSDVLSAGAELLSLSTSLFTLFSPTVRYVLLLLFLFGALILFIKSIM